MSKAVSFREYVREILNTVTYRPCEDGPGFVAVAEALPGCMTQGGTFEDTRELLNDAIETWLLSVIKDGEALPVVNNCSLAISVEELKPTSGESGENRSGHVLLSCLEISIN
jgi:predicted RNase H-like HicB family nuclease